MTRSARRKPDPWEGVKLRMRDRENGMARDAKGVPASRECAVVRLGRQQKDPERYDREGRDSDQEVGSRKLH